VTQESRDCIREDAKSWHEIKGGRVIAFRKVVRRNRRPMEAATGIVVFIHNKNRGIETGSLGI